jgi:hypothetical protein
VVQIKRLVPDRQCLKRADSGLSAIAMQWQECANSGHWLSARRTGKLTRCRRYRPSGLVSKRRLSALAWPYTRDSMHSITAIGIPCVANWVGLTGIKASRAPQVFSAVRELHRNGCTDAAIVSKNCTVLWRVADYRRAPGYNKYTIL